jgi:threonine synthase
MPDWLAIPVGSGGNLNSYFKGLRELRELGLINDFPRLVGVQADGSAPVVEAFERNLDHTPKIADAHTIAHSIKDNWAPEGDSALRAIRETSGLAVGVSDKEILNAQKALSSKEGLFVEPASAAPLAAVTKLLHDGKMDRNESVVIITTGSGLNQPDVVLGSGSWNQPQMIKELDVTKFGPYVSAVRN